jgi:hypothetical protein
MKIILLLVFLVSRMSYAGENVTVSPVSNSEKTTELLAKVKDSVENKMSSSATAQIKKAFPNFFIGDWVSGDLNQDGIQDIAVFISNDEGYIPIATEKSG